MQIPQLAGNEKWYFRAMKTDDAQAIFEINNDPQTLKFTSLNQQHTLADIISWIEHYPSYSRHGFGLWIIADIHTQVVAGLCGLRVRKDLNNAIDLSYRMHPDWRRRGIASMAVKACVDFGFKDLCLNRILAQVHNSNFISSHLLQKLGFEKGELNDVWQDWIISNPIQTVK
jgi:RimJ/RimL family protein N-acetyltransferase